MYKIPAYQYIFLSAIDLGFLLERPSESLLAKRSHKELVKQRINGKVGETILNLLSQTGDAKQERLTLGTFVRPEPEGSLLKRDIEEACKDGGKRIFTQHFLDNKAPTIFRREQSAFLFDPHEQGGMPQVTPNGRLSLNSGRSLHYQGSRLRLFQAGVLGLEFRFGYNDRPEATEAPLEAEHVITDIRLLEEDYVKGAAYSKLRRVFLTLSQNPNRGGLSWRTEWLEYDEFLRLSSTHRVLLVRSLEKDNKALAIDEILEDPEGLKEISGVLNRAEWYKKYWKKYLGEIGAKFISYQNDEIFITDGDSSLIYFPSYWTRSKNKEQYIENLIAAKIYLLSWDSLRNYFETYIDSLGTGADVLRSNKRPEVLAAYEELTQAKAVVRLIKDALSVGSLVSHGFTARVLSQFLRERSMREKIDDLAQKLDGFSQSLTIAASFAQSERTTRRSQLWQKITIGIGLAALVTSALFNVLSYFQRREELRLRKQSQGQSVQGLGSAPRAVPMTPSPIRGRQP